MDNLHVVKRGFIKEDKQQFTGSSLEKLKEAAKDTKYLLNRGYSVKGVTTFIGNHFMFSERQRLALARAVSSDYDIDKRKSKQCIFGCCNEAFQTYDREGSLIEEVFIDGFNTIITLEVALSDSPVLKCMDGTMRDLAGLRGTYRIIDKTKKAVCLIMKYLVRLNIQKAVFYLDAPVSNSGRLKTFILEIAQNYDLNVSVEVINNVDSVLQRLGGVITSDAIILNHCKSYINLLSAIVSEIENVWIVEL